MDFCPNCGAKGVGGYEFCPNCGGALPKEGAVGPAGKAVQSGLYAERVKGTSRTRTGLLLLTVGVLFGLVPAVGTLIGGLVALVGAFFVILGRKAFGKAHANSVLAAIIVYIASFLVILVITSIVVFSAIDFTGGTFDPADITAATEEAAWVVIPAAVLEGVAICLFVWQLETEWGRAILVSAIAVGFLGAVLSVYVLSTTSLDLANLLWTTAASAPGYVLLAVAFYIPYRRIERGEIPVVAAP